MAPAPLVPVWMDSWQYECCGDPFAIGDRVRWTLQPADLQFLAPPLVRCCRTGTPTTCH